MSFQIRSITAMAVKTPKTAVGIVRTEGVVSGHVTVKSSISGEDAPAMRSSCGLPYQRP